MAKTYIDLEELESVFSKYAIPYTNIFDELHTWSAEEVAEEMSVLDLRSVLEKKQEVFATQIWCREDIEASVKVVADIVGFEADETFINAVIEEVKSSLEDCSDNWSRLNAAVKTCIKRRENK